MEKISIILIDNKNVDILDFCKNCEQSFENFEVYFCTQQKVQDLKNVKQVVTSEKNVDKIINSIIPKISGDKLCLIRNYNGNFDDVKRMVRKVKKDNEICKIKEKSGKFVDFFKNLLDIVINFVFGYKLFHTSLAMIVFGKSATCVLKTLPNPSTYTKVNKWAGIDILQVSANAPSVKFKPKLIGNFITLGVCFVLSLACILCWTLIKYNKPMIFLKSLYILIIAISVTIILFEIIIICVKKLVGDNECDKINLDIE